MYMCVERGRGEIANLMFVIHAVNDIVFDFHSNYGPSKA